MRKKLLLPGLFLFSLLLCLLSSSGSAVIPSDAAAAETSSFYQGASQWSVGTLDKAAEYGLITDSIKAKMNAPISREEFAELAVRLYEKCSGLSATVGDTSIFADTNNPEIFKACSLGIVSGTNKEKHLFSPSNLTTREQVSTMLYNTVKALGVDITNAGTAKNFNDNEKISGYAVVPVAYMSGHGFILGSRGNFDPQGICTREMAVVIATQVYESYSTENHVTANTSPDTATNQNAAANSDDNSYSNTDNGTNTKSLQLLPGQSGNGNSDNPEPQQPGVASDIFPMVSDALIHYIDEWDGGDGTVMYTSNFSITDLIAYYTDTSLYREYNSIMQIPDEDGVNKYMITTANLQYFIFISPNRDTEHGKQNIVQICVYNNSGGQD